MKLVPASVTMKVARKVLTLKKNSPHIFFVGGVAGVIGSGVLACRATLKLENKLDEIKSELDAVLPVSDPVEGGGSVPDQEKVKDLGYVCVKSGLALGRLYGPSILLGGVSIAALTGSHIQLTRRNAALTVTLAGLSKAYDEYRARVATEVGKQRELEIYRNVQTTTETVDGKKKTTKISADGEHSVYARFFDEGSLQWVKDAEMNRYFLQCQQTWFNHKLRANGHVFLNEVYDALGIPRSAAGQIVGWVINGEGDGFVDFGMYEFGTNEFINGREPRVLLDFNVDGPVQHLLDDEPPVFVKRERGDGE